MKSPDFSTKTEKLAAALDATRFKIVWKSKIRDKMREQIIIDPIDHIDFHLAISDEAKKLAQNVRDGVYTPGQVRRILVEKSRGLCRQLVIPQVRDAIILQCLSDSLYSDIKDKAPSKQSFFEPQDSSFSVKGIKKIYFDPPYGSYKAWLAFQREIFNFAKVYKFLVITDIANYYDYIRYDHLRNIISSNVLEVRESILDMLIFVLSGMLWQPNYMPRAEIGLPQINLDAPRVLANCFLYDLDRFLMNVPKVQFARFMDDIDVGVNSIQEGKKILRDMDLVLQTRQVRLNSGKTQILTNTEAERHFRVRENIFLNRLSKHLDWKSEKGMQFDREKRLIRMVVSKKYWSGEFNGGNGDKILKRLLSIMRRIEATVDPRILSDIISERSSCRSAAYVTLRSQPLTVRSWNIVLDYLTSGKAVDEASFVEASNALVSAAAWRPSGAASALRTLISFMGHKEFFRVYSAIWLLSKYGSELQLLDYCEKSFPVWRSDPWLGRLVGGMRPRFTRKGKMAEFESLVWRSANPDAHSIFMFHEQLSINANIDKKLVSYIQAVNPTYPNKITHPKLLISLSVLSNPNVSSNIVKKFSRTHTAAQSDLYYKRMIKISGAIAAGPASSTP